MVVFNYLVPALVLDVIVQNVLPIGSGDLSTGGSLVLGHVTNGTLLSEPGFETPINATISHTNDWPTIDPDLLHSRPDFIGLVSTDDGAYLQIHATGIQAVTPEVAAITTGMTNNASLPYGAFYSVFVVSFRTGSAKYKNLEDSIFVGSETVKALGDGVFRGGLRISKVFSTATNITLE